MSNGIITQRATRRRGTKMERAWLRRVNYSQTRRGSLVVIQSRLNYLTKNNYKMHSLKAQHHDLTPYIRRIYAQLSVLESALIK
jgi:hypothetical protein